MTADDDNAGLVRACFDAVNRRDVDAALAYMHPDVEFRSLGMAKVEDSGYRGHAGIRQYARDAAELWSDMRVAIDRTVTAGDAVVVLGRVYAEGDASGVGLTEALGWVFRIRSGKVVRIDTYPSPAEALAAVGLEG
jgi:ketosteroid isomerase-like protein